MLSKLIIPIAKIQFTKQNVSDGVGILLDLFLSLAPNAVYLPWFQYFHFEGFNFIRQGDCFFFFADHFYLRLDLIDWSRKINLVYQNVFLVDHCGFEMVSVGLLLFQERSADVTDLRYYFAFFVCLRCFHVQA